MFTHIVPKFEKGRILKTGMLENLRDYPRSFLDIRYQDYSDGIIAGTNVSVREHVLCISPGIIKHAGRLYLMEEEQEVSYSATGREMVLKVRFLEDVDQPDFTRYSAEILVETAEASSGTDELELGRFKLKTGAELRSDYQDFSDMATEYNTWSSITAHYAGKREATLRPEILHYFAAEMLSSRAVEPQDTMFSLMCLNAERVERKTILYYLSSRSGSAYREYSNMQIHNELSRILSDSGRANSLRRTALGPQRMIVD
ncbi:hypothetical protein [Paenibacillus durus]|uniref:DNA and RNA helicase n=2 Tax=Paenibacillus durus TaxID=44251 RepID=A0A0F7FBI5_PAEDU|nr:hypothetical protein [Paenibacillus durus]AKG36023.1 DNA and RNA helicase [Paenibacillus durus ATCC 35681]